MVCRQDEVTPIFSCLLGAAAPEGVTAFLQTCWLLKCQPGLLATWTTVVERRKPPESPCPREDIEPGSAGENTDRKEIRVSLMPWRFWKNGPWAAQVQPGAHKSILSQMLTARQCISGKYHSPYFYFGPCEVLWMSMQNAELIESREHTKEHRPTKLYSRGYTLHHDVSQMAQMYPSVHTQITESSK